MVRKIWRSTLFAALAALLALGTLPLPASAQEPDATVIPAGVNVRQGPGTSYDIIGRLGQGAGVALLARDELAPNVTWLFVRTADDLHGWISADLLSVRAGLDVNALPTRAAPDAEAVPLGEAPAPALPAGGELAADVTARSNFRTGPGTSYPVIATLPIGATLHAQGRSVAGDWVFGTVNGQEGWIFASLVAISAGNVSSLPVTDKILPAPAGRTAGAVAPAAGGRGIAGFAYGGHVESFAYPQLMQQAGMTWVKRQIRFTRGAPGAVAQGAIDQAHGMGFKILLGVVGSAGDVTQPGYFEEYARFVGEVAALSPDAIEVWNEQNIDREWANGAIDPNSYTQLLALAYNAIKGANPNVVVISGAPAPTGAEGAFGTAAVWNDDRYVRGMAAAGAARYMDCIGAHYNEGIVPPSWTSGDPRGNYYTRYFWGMVSTYSGAFGGARPVCFTELGYLSPEGLGPLPGSFAWGADTSVAEQAQWLAEAVRLARSSGRVRLVILWNVDFTAYGADPMAGYAMVRPGGGCPACDALAGVR